MKVKETYETEVKARLKALDAEIADLAQKIDSAGADAQAAYSQKLNRLQRKQNEIQTRFVALENAGETAWGELRSGFGEALSVFSQSVDDARAEFKSEYESPVGEQVG